MIYSQRREENRREWKSGKRGAEEREDKRGERTEEKRKWGDSGRHDIRGQGAKKYRISGFEGSQAVPARSSDSGNAYDRN
jgi:hypothetical protein